MSHQSTSLNLSELLLSDLPPEIGNLSNLQDLWLIYNQLTALPPEIGNLSNLQNLWLSNNQLTTLPPEIGNLPNLQNLRLNDNQLTTLPSEIGNLSNLQDLSLSSNQLTTLPLEIGRLSNLQFLYLGGNRFTSLPVEILTLPPSCLIGLPRCPFTEGALNRLRSITSQPGYDGPRIYHLVPEERTIVTMPLFSIKNLSRQLRQTYLNSALPVPDNLEKRLGALIGHPGATYLHTWLYRLNDVADSRNAEHPEYKTRLNQQIIELLELAQAHEEFRTQFFLELEAASTTCGDRVALSIVDLHVAKCVADRAQQLSLQEQPDLTELYTFLTKSIWPFELLKKIAQNKVESLACCDPIEVYLGLFLKTKASLAASGITLPIPMNNMLYFRFSSLSEADIAGAVQNVQQQVASSNDTAQIQFLCEHSLWHAALEKKYPAAYEEACDNPENLKTLSRRLIQEINPTPPALWSIKF